MQYFIQRAALLPGLIMLLSLSGCASTEDKATEKKPNNVEIGIYNKAKTAFNAGNYKTAASLFEPLANNGNADAQYSLGYLYYHGKGTKKDINQAVRWFTLAAKQGNHKAIVALNTIEDMLKKTTMNETPGVNSEQQPLPAQADDERNIIDLTQVGQNKSSKPAPVIQAIPLNAEIKKQQPNIQITENQPAKSDDPVVSKPVPEKIVPIEADAAPVRALSATEINHRKWILRQPSGHYTIQLASSPVKKRILDYMRNVALDGVYYYADTLNNITRYQVIHGSFNSFSKARRKLNLLVRRGYKDAWIKDFKGIKNSLRQ